MSDPIPQPKQVTDVLDYVTELEKYYASSARRAGRWLWVLKTAALFFSVCVTVLSGIPAFRTDHYGWAVTVVGGLASFFSGMITLGKSQEYYVIAGSQRGKIRGERLLYMSGGGDYEKETTQEGRLRLLGERVTAIYGEGREHWESVNKQGK